MSQKMSHCIANKAELQFNIFIQFSMFGSTNQKSVKNHHGLKLLNSVFFGCWSEEYKIKSFHFLIHLQKINSDWNIFLNKKYLKMGRGDGDRDDIVRLGKRNGQQWPSYLWSISYGLCTMHHSLWSMLVWALLTDFSFREWTDD